MTTSRCLCGAVTWEIGQPLQWMSHCHCSRCRKTHGALHATYVGGPANTYRLSGAEHIVTWESAPGFSRCFCGRCGSVVPGTPFGDLMFVPAGNIDGDPGVRPMAHIFAASRPPWVRLDDGLPAFDAYPPGFDAGVVPDRAPIDAPGKTRGSCLCGAVAFVVEGEALRCWHCHCTRCQRARSAAFASNLVTRADGVRFTRGEDQLVDYKLPEATHYTVTFCRACGSGVPRRDPSRDLAIIPLGSLDDDPGLQPSGHIFVGSMPAWDVIADSLPQYDEYPPELRR